MPRYAVYIRAELVDVGSHEEAEHAAQALAATLPRHALVETHRYKFRSTPVRNVEVHDLSIISNES